MIVCKILIKPPTKMEVQLIFDLVSIIINYC